MADIRYKALAATTAILLIGTVYSALYDTYLDTSHPVLGHHPHHLADSHFFASKSNPLNVYLIKYAWAWTSAAFAFTFLTSPPTQRTRDRLLRYLALTALWLLFVNWFFGPPILQRVTVLSGGECIAHFPSGDALVVPLELCINQSTLTPDSHPMYFETVMPGSPEIGKKLSVRPRLRKGHDLSGHVFLLTVSILFLTDQLRPSLNLRNRSRLHTYAIGSQIALIAIWLFALYTTAVYFHSPFEKLTGYRMFSFP
jgi:hypothetical protein